jgi:hypothetical protein
VLRFSTEDEEISEISEILNSIHLPVGISLENENGKSLKSQLRAWWKSRSIPASRQNLNTALELLGNITTDYLIEKSYGLSLSDHYWAKPEKSRLSWKDVNFFHNSFSEDVGKALFGTLNSSSTKSLNLFSPDNTSDGWLKKKWIINNGERFLLKAGSLWQQEPFNEALASEICRRLEVNCVPYKIIKADRTFYSSCPDFITENTELVPAWHIISTQKKEKSTSNFKHLINCCQKIGIGSIENIKRGICTMLTIDFIIANTDRHYNNFGFLRNPDTLEWLGLAPVYDSGTAMFHDTMIYDLKNPYFQDSRNIKAKTFASNQKEQMNKIPCKEYCSNLNLKKLDGIPDFFKDLISENPYIENERAELLRNILFSRIKETENLLH